MLTRPTHSRLLRPSGRFVAWCLFLTSLCIPVLSPRHAKGSPGGDVVPEEIVRIRAIRQDVQTYVRKIKEGSNPDSEIYLESKRLYDLAYTKYSAWDDATKAAIMAAWSSKIRTNTKYRRMSQDAGDAIAAFIDHCADNVSPVERESRDVYLFRDWGIGLWNEYKYSVPGRRARSVRFFERMTKWSQWNDI